MSSRDAILSAVRRHRPEPVPLPESGSLGDPATDPVGLFVEKIREIGGAVYEVTPGTVASTLADAYPHQTHIASALPDEVTGTVFLQETTDPHALAHLDLLVCAGTLGVAENGAVWVPESMMVHRAAPFLTQHLALVIARAQIVSTMHEAYARLQVDAEGFGVFIAGPSKTADIEQALVIGAHGPRSLTVLLL